MPVFNSETKAHFRDIVDAAREPLLTSLTIVLIILIFVIVPLHAAGTITTEGYGTVLALLLASCVLVESARIAVAVIFGGVVLAFAAGVVRSRGVHSDLDLYLDASASLLIELALIWVVSRAVFAPGRVTYHRISGAVLLYLTIGLMFAGLFTLVGLQAVHAFSGLTISRDPALASSLIYFSFVTLTSIGYGDIVPVHPMARALCNLEGIIGQLFPATLLARLVTLEIQDRSDRASKQKDDEQVR